MKSLSVAAVWEVAAALAVTLGMAGCGAPSSADASSSSSSAVAVVKASDGTVFSGTYAHDYRDAYEGAKTELGKGILKDSKITDAEWQELKDALNGCTRNFGATMEFQDEKTSAMTVKTDDKIYDTEKANETMGKVHQCEIDTDFYSISSIRDFEEQDAQTGGDYLGALLTCYQRHGLADKGLTVEEYKQVMSDEGRAADMFGKYTDSSRSDYDERGAQQFESCNSDPNS